jgi:hypothetical protein
MSFFAGLDRSHSFSFVEHFCSNCVVAFSRRRKHAGQAIKFLVMDERAAVVTESRRVNAPHLRLDALRKDSPGLRIVGESVITDIVSPASKDVCVWQYHLASGARTEIIVASLSNSLRIARIWVAT